MNNRKLALKQDLNSFDFRKTKNLVNNYFEYIEELKWKQARLNVQKGLVANYELSLKDTKQQYISIGKDTFNLSTLEDNDGEIKKQLLGFHWAKSILSEQEQLYIIEYFVNHKYEDEIVDLLGFNTSDSRAFRKLKRCAIYKFAYVLNLVMEKQV